VEQGMKKEKREPRQARELRRKAEELLKSRSLEAEELDPAAIPNLLHELQVHQIELEMQNDELRQAQVALEASYVRYTDLYDFAPVGYLTLDETGLILEANLTAARQLAIPRSRLLKQSFPLLAPREDREKLRGHLRQVFQSQERQSAEIRLAPKDRPGFFVQVDSIFVQDAAGKGLCHTSFTDITDRKRAEEILRMNEARATALLRLHQMTAAPLPEITRMVVDDCVSLTQSKFGFVGFISEDETIMHGLLCSARAMEQCIIEGPVHFPIDQGGLWAEMVRQRRPILVNDYQAAHPGKRGCPPGHVPLSRFLGVPVVAQGRPVAVAAVANKERDYDEGDLYQIALLMEGTWSMLQRRQAEEALRQAHAELELRVEERTAELRLANEYLLQEIKERELIEQRLRKSEERFRTLFHTVGSIIISTSPDRLILEFNQEAEHQTGWQRQEVLGKDVLEVFIPQDARSRVAAEMAKIMAGGLIRGLEFPLRMRDGPTRLFLWNANLVPAVEGQPGEIMLAGIDITELKKAEGALRQSARRLRLLTSQLLTIQEKERGRISRELHDELGQSLIIMKFQLQSLFSKVPKTEEALHRSGLEILRYLDATIENVRRLSQDLSPFLLEDLGLPAAIGHLLGNIRDYAGLEVTSARVDELARLFSPEAQITIYRILQECLTNIIKHARASRVSVKIHRRDGEVSFIVRDDGQGFDVRQARSPRAGDKGIGLTAMQERLRLIQGTLNIRSQKGKGTGITFTIPIDLKDSEHDTLPDLIG
jgi:PAS domain S-box-containing protein